MNESSLLMLLEQNFHFLRPLWLLALIPALLLVLYLWRINESASSWDRAIDKDLLPYLLDGSKSAAERTPLVLLLTLWTLAILALAGPVWEKIAQPVQQRQDALVIVYDQSLSMYAADFDPNRLTVSKRKVLDVLDMRTEGQTALVVYAGDAHTVTPLTEDSVTIRALVPSINPNMMPAFGSNSVAAIERAKGLLTDAGAASGTILLVTDGVERRDHAQIGELLQQTGYRLSILGVGTEDGAPIPAAGGDFLRSDTGEIIIPQLDKDSLQDLAELVNGRYVDMQLTSDDVNYLMAEDDFFSEEDLADVDQNFDIWAEVGPWLLLLVLPLSALIFRRGWILSATATIATLSALTPTAPVEAAEWIDLWKTRDQRGEDAYANQDPISAASLFTDPGWQGSAAYHAGDYPAAVQAFASALSTEDADSHYNLGNAYAKGANFEQAIASYNVAIALQPDHEDAIHNREIVQKLLEEQQQQEEEQSQEEQMSDEEEQEQQEEQEEQQEEESEPQEEEQQEQQEGGDEEEQEENEPQDGEQKESEEENQGEEPQLSNAENESQESLEQWLRRIDDDPGELLQRKFQFEYRRRQVESRSNNQSAETQIW
jgi:Ca-activated chloride channel family protein